jgi:hypothetical protein
MARLADRLDSSPQSSVLLVEGPDDICSACPHLHQSRCDRFGDHVEQLDENVKSGLGLSIGEKRDWAILVQALADRLDKDRLFEFCGRCSWRELDYCSDGLASAAAGDDGGGRS